MEKSIGLASKHSETDKNNLFDPFLAGTEDIMNLNLPDLQELSSILFSKSEQEDMPSECPPTISALEVDLEGKTIQPPSSTCKNTADDTMQILVPALSPTSPTPVPRPAFSTFSTVNPDLPPQLPRIVQQQTATAPLDVYCAFPDFTMQRSCFPFQEDVVETSPNPFARESYTSAEHMHERADEISAVVRNNGSKRLGLTPAISKSSTGVGSLLSQPGISSLKKLKSALKPKRRKTAGLYPTEMLEDLSGTTSAKARNMSPSERGLVLFKRMLRNRESAKRSRANKQINEKFSKEVLKLKEVFVLLQNRCTKLSGVNRTLKKNGFEKQCQIMLLEERIKGLKKEIERKRAHCSPTVEQQNLRA